MEVDYTNHREETFERVFFRVAIVKRSKRGRTDEAKLMQKAATFFSYYPGEPYFYADRPDPTPMLCEVKEL
jgi:hypothetical protein